MRKKILIVTPFSPKYIGGAETFCKDLMTEAKKKYNVRVLTLKAQFKDWDNPSVFVNLYIALKLLFGSLVERMGYEYQTVHCLGITATAVGVVLKKLFGVRLISTTLALYGFKNYPKWKWHILEWIFRQVDKVFVEDYLGRNDMMMLNMPLGKIGQFMHWCDLEKFKPSVAYCPPLEILFVGRPIRKKGKHIIKLVENALKNEDINFIYAEDIAYEDLKFLYQATDIVVVPSLYLEGVSRVVIEAAASGCCVIASDRGSLPNLVEQFGIVIPATLWHFKSEIMKLYNDREMLVRYKTIAREYAEKNFSNRNAEVILDEY